MNDSIKILCNEDDPKIDTIAERMNILNQAIENDALVAISCFDGEDGESKILLAIIGKDAGEEYVQYSPIGVLFYDEDTSYTRLTPPSDAIPVDEEVDVQH